MKTLGKTKIKNFVKDTKKELVEVVYGTGDNTLEVVIDPNISFEKYLIIINLAIEVATIDGEYRHDVLEFAFNSTVISQITNIGDADAESIWAIMCNTPIIDDIEGAIGTVYYNMRADLISRFEFLAKESISTGARMGAIFNELAAAGEGLDQDKIKEISDALVALNNDKDMQGELIKQMINTDNE